MALNPPLSIDLLAEQFAAAPFPCWLVNDSLDVISANDTARKRYPGHCLPDGIRLFLAPTDSDAVVASLSRDIGITKRPLLLLHYGAALAFTPVRVAEGGHCALVMLTPVSEFSDETDSEPRRQLESVGSLVITQGIRRCMTDIVAALSAASETLHAAGIQEVDDHLQRINQSCYRMLRTADNLARNMQADANFKDNREVVNFWNSCAELMDATNTLLRTGKGSFSYALPDSQVYVDCDFEQIISVVLNLICNSYLYGGPEVAVSITGRDIAGRVLLTATDNGPGLSPEMQERLFQPFCSWDALDQSNAGMGLGLHLARALVTAAGGTISLHTDSTGTTVALSLPTVPPPDRPLILGSSSGSYLSNRYSPLYLALCDVVEVPRC